jgi:DNA-binding transcriptional LysR family regulator
MRRCKNPPVLNWDDLRHLVALHHAGSLARAATLLAVDKATVARRLEALEDSLHCRLIERLPAGYRLTEAGHHALEHALAMAAQAAELEARLGDAQAAMRGVVRVTAPAWFCRLVLIPELPAFRAQHPQLELQLLTTNLLVSMPKREADIAVRNLRAEERGLASRQLGRLRSAIYAAQTYAKQRGLPRTRDELAVHHLIAYQERICFLPEYAWLADAGAPVAFRASDTLALAEACEAGIGLAVLPCVLGDAAPALERVPVAPVAEETIWSVVPSERLKQPAVRATLQWIAALFERRQAELAPP